MTSADSLRYLRSEVHRRARRRRATQVALRGCLAVLGLLAGLWAYAVIHG